MRYIKLFLLVLIFFLAMMFFAQNQTSFAVKVPLQFHIMPVDQPEAPDPAQFVGQPEAEGLVQPSRQSLTSEVLPSEGLPVYAIMIICFTLGALLVLLLLLWDRLLIMGKLSAAKRKIKALERKLSASEDSLGKAEGARKQAEAKLQDELKDAEQRVNAALRAAGHPAHGAE